MDREESLEKFHWHRWVASNKGAVTISKEDMEEYYMLIKGLLDENKKLLHELTIAEVMLEGKK